MPNLFKWEPDYYYVDKLKSMPFSESALREEYGRIRKVLKNRILRLRQAGYQVSGLEDYLTRQDISTYTAKSARKEDLPYLIADTARLLRKQTTTVAGRKKYIQSSVERLHETGYTEITESNYESFGDFMKEWRDQSLDLLYSSEQAAELFETAIARAINQDEIKAKFEEYLKRQEELATFKPKTREEKDKWSSSRTLETIDEIKKNKRK